MDVNSTVTGATQAGASVTQNRGGGLVNFMGYPLQSTNSLGQNTTYIYDNKGRLTSTTTLAGTGFAQTSTTAYDLSADLALDPNALFSVRNTDSTGNITVQVFDARQRQISTYTTLNGGSQVKTAAFTYDSTDRVIQATLFGNGYQKIHSYYYSPGTALLLATVPNYGLTKGRIIDGVNGNTLEFSYQPVSGGPQTTIGKIYGPVKISHSDNLSKLLLSDGLIDADAANVALGQGFDLINTPSKTSISPTSNKMWASSGQAPQALVALYQAIGQPPQNPTGSGSTTALMEYNSYGYDEWNRQASVTRYSLINSGPAIYATPQLSKTVTSQSYNTSQRAVTVTMPQGQQKTSTYNLLNGLQSASLNVNGAITQLGSFVHDGLGRILKYQDKLNNSQSSASYQSGTGLLLGRTDAYGNQETFTYDPVSFKLTQSTLTPAGGGVAVTVNRQYDNWLRPTGISDNLGNSYGWSYNANGQLAGRTLILGGHDFGGAFQYTLNYDNYGSLTHVTNPFLPYPNTNGGNCQMTQNNMSNHGYNNTRDQYGRLSQITEGSYHGVNRNFIYDDSTGQISGETLANLPSVFGCADTGNLTLETVYTHDDNLRLVGKAVTRSDLATASAPKPVADLGVRLKAPKASVNQSLNKVTIQASADAIDRNAMNQALTATTAVCAKGSPCGSVGQTSGSVGQALFAQSFDPSGHVASSRRSDFSGNSLSENYSYDLQTGYLLDYANDGNAQPYAYKPSSGSVTSSSYSYDFYGNLTNTIMSGPNGSLTRYYLYNNAKNPFQLGQIQEQQCQGSQCSNWSGQYTYDVAGSTVKDAYGRSLTYDGRGLVHTIQRADGQSESFNRDGLGRTVQRTASWLPNNTVYDFGMAKFSTANQLWQVGYIGGTASYIQGTNLSELPGFTEIEELGSKPVNNLTYGANAQGFGLIANTSFLPFGSATNLLNVNAGYPAGLNNTTSYPDSAMGTASGADVGTGLRMLGDYRAYDPVLGRFLQWDSLAPLGRGGLNGYAFANNDPVNLWDPSGHYAKAIAHRYGPKPLEAHHSDGGSFWDGFLAGFKHGVKSFFTQPYNYAKSFVEDLAHGHLVGATEMAFDTAADLYVQGATGMAGAMVMQEFVSLSPSKIFSGKSPVKSNGSGSRNAYEWGYDMGGEAGNATSGATVAILTMAVGAELGALADSSTVSSADADVTEDATGSGKMQLKKEPAQALRNPEPSQAKVSARQESGELAELVDKDPLAEWPKLESEPVNQVEPAEPQTRESWMKRALNNKVVNWIVRNVILPIDPTDPHPWDEGLSPGEHVKASIGTLKQGWDLYRTGVNIKNSWSGGGDSSSSSGGSSKPSQGSSNPATTQSNPPYLPQLPPLPNLGNGGAEFGGQLPIIYSSGTGNVTGSGGSSANP